MMKINTNNNTNAEDKHQQQH